MSYATDALAIFDNQTDAVGATLHVKRYLHLDEANGAGGAIDYSTNATNGTYGGSPTFGVVGPIYSGPANHGSAITLAGATMGVDCGVVTGLMDMLDADGVFVATWFKSTSTAIGVLMGSNSATFTNGLTIVLNRQNSGATNAYYLSVEVADAAGVTRRYTWNRADLLPWDGIFHRLVIYADKATAILWIDGVRQSAPTNNGVSPGVCTDVGVGKLVIGGYSQGATVNYLIGSTTLSHMMIGTGQPTDAQVAADWAVGTYTDWTGLPGWHFYVEPSAGTCWTATNGTGAVADLSVAKRVDDLSGWGSHPLQSNAALAPIYMVARNWGFPCLSFDANFYQRAADFGGGVAHQISMQAGSATPFNQQWMTMLAVVRLSNGSILHSTAQSILQILAGSTGLVSLVAKAFYAQIQHLTSFYPPDSMPLVNCAPGLLTIGLCVGYGNNVGQMHLWMGRHTSTSTGAAWGGDVLTTSDTINLCGTAVDPAAGGDDLAGVRVHAAGIIRGPITNAQYQSWAGRWMARYAESQNPALNIIHIDDSVGCGQQWDPSVPAEWGGGYWNQMPSSYRRASHKALGIGGRFLAEYAAAPTGGIPDLASADCYDPNCQNIAVIEVGVNDCNSANPAFNTSAAMIANLDAIIAKIAGATGAGFPTLRTKIVVMKLYDNSTGAGKTAYNAHIDALKAAGTIDAIVTVPDLGGGLFTNGPHPVYAGHTIIKNAVNPKLAGLAPGTLAGNRQWRGRDFRSNIFRR